MNGPHDMGGMQCYGPVIPEPNEPLFHASWERDALALTVAMGATGMWNIDQSRSARESLPPLQYMSSSYYQIWLAGMEKLMLERGMVNGDELASGEAKIAPVPVKQSPDRERMRAILAVGASAERPAVGIAQFSPGNQVRAVNRNPQGHTRLPHYIRGKAGTVENICGFHVFPEATALGRQEAGWLYTIAFSAADLFGQGDHTVLVDCWEATLERA